MLRIQRERELQEEEQKYSFKPKLNKNKNYGNYTNMQTKGPTSKIIDPNFFNRMQTYDMMKNKK